MRKNDSPLTTKTAEIKEFPKPRNSLSLIGHLERLSRLLSDEHLARLMQTIRTMQKNRLRKIVVASRSDSEQGEQA